jgi:hypothetical protein
LRGLALAELDRVEVAGAREAPEALEPRDLVLLEEVFDSLRHLRDDRVLARLHLGDVDLDARHVDAVRLQVVARLLVFLGGSEQRLGGDASHVEAGAAQGELALGLRQPSMQAVFRPSCAARTAAM